MIEGGKKIHVAHMSEDAYLNVNIRYVDAYLSLQAFGYIA